MGVFCWGYRRAHFDIIYPGDATLFPRALLHFEINSGTKTASFISALNSENPGTLVCTKSLSTSPTQWCQLSSIPFYSNFVSDFSPSFTKIQDFVTTAKEICNIYNIFIIYKKVSEKVLCEFVKEWVSYLQVWFCLTYRSETIAFNANQNHMYLSYCRLLELNSSGLPKLLLQLHFIAKPQYLKKLQNPFPPTCLLYNWPTKNSVFLERMFHWVSFRPGTSCLKLMLVFILILWLYWMPSQGKSFSSLLLVIEWFKKKKDCIL